MPVAVARGKLSCKKAINVSLGTIGSIEGKNRTFSTVVNPNACLTFPMVLKSLYEIGFEPI